MTLVATVTARAEFRPRPGVAVYLSTDTADWRVCWSCMCRHPHGSVGSICCGNQSNVYELHCVIH